MEQRPLRLGDIVDDYCPRERRVTNHAVVAIVEDAIRQTRCTTCDTEHVFKGGQEPKRRLRPALARPSGLVDVPASAAAVVAAEPDEVPAGPLVASSAAAAEESPAADSTVQAGESAAEAWSHRRLIRATLPKTDELPPPRPIPEFTMHQRPAGRGGRGFRQETNGRTFEGGGHHRGRAFHGNGNHSGGNGHPVADGDDEINGNVAGPGPNGRSGNGHAAPAPHPGGRRRRGRRRRAR